MSARARVFKAVLLSELGPVLQPATVMITSAAVPTTGAGNLPIRGRGYLPAGNATTIATSEDVGKTSPQRSPGADRSSS
jgi:hypothetical protein